MLQKLQHSKAMREKKVALIYEQTVDAVQRYFHSQLRKRNWNGKLVVDTNA